ncbi:dihydroorotase [Brachybacterium sp. Marseille-Q7125]|uniref:dihydroorotase n=1 Tax=Brachybacterium sp. Marseille-Q7125 TaxID=2932815 RepID=UPI001FF0FC4D|nr:dihydroorotase [Brachybacterium sp. Marseille-Q7125]
MTTTTPNTAPIPTLLIRGGRPYGEDIQDLLLADGRITAVGPDLEAPEDAEVIDAEGCIILPGLVDLHTHLREPGGEEAETIESGTRAAARGGFTAVHAMANTTPVADTAGVVEQVARQGEAAGWCEVRPVGAVTVGLAGERLAELDAMATSRARVRVFSDDGSCVHDPVLMRRALEYVKAFDGVIAQHSQDPRLTEGSQMHEGLVSAELGLAGWPAVAEESIIARDVLLAQHVGSRLHVCHLSTAGSVDIVRWAKQRGIDVTCEVTPHHLLLTDERVRTFDAVNKVNPPLRTAADVEAVRTGLADGTIDIVATDHAPHPADAKDREWDQAAMGMTGLETALAIVQHTMVDENRLSWRDIARVLSEQPARIGRDEDQGRPLQAGEAANILVWDPRPRRMVDVAEHASRSSNSPFAGLELPGLNRLTVLKGRPTVRDGAVVQR